VGKWGQAANIYQKMLGAFPQLHELLTRKIEAAGGHINPPEK